MGLTCFLLDDNDAYLFSKSCNRWHVGGLPTFGKISHALFDKKFGDEPSPLHFGFSGCLRRLRGGQKAQSQIIARIAR